MDMNEFNIKYEISDSVSFKNAKTVMEKINNLRNNHLETCWRIRKSLMEFLKDKKISIYNVLYCTITAEENAVFVNIAFESLLNQGTFVKVFFDLEDGPFDEFVIIKIFREVK